MRYPVVKTCSLFLYSCFLALLLIAAVLWKIKQKFDRYRRRQRLFVEMEQMASRPFGKWVDKKILTFKKSEFTGGFFLKLSHWIKYKKNPSFSGSVLCDLDKLPDHSNGGSGGGGSGIPNSSTVTSTLSAGVPSGGDPSGSGSSAGRTRSSSSVTGGGT